MRLIHFIDEGRYLVSSRYAKRYFSSEDDAAQKAEEFYESVLFNIQSLVNVELLFAREREARKNKESVITKKYLSIEKPETLHELLQQALDDIAEKEKDPSVFLYPDYWHKPGKLTCCMFLEGAWMERVIPRDMEIKGSEHLEQLFDNDTNDCIYALNVLSQGDVGAACEYFYGPDFVFDKQGEHYNFGVIRIPDFVVFDDWLPQMRGLQRLLEMLEV